MSRYLLRLSIAVLSFSIGLFGVWASGYWNRFENFVDRFSSEQNINVSAIELNQYDPAKEIEDTKAVYKVILGESMKVVRKKPQNYYASFDFDERGKTEEVRARAFLANIQKRLPQVENTALIDYLNKSKVVDSLRGLPELTVLLDENTSKPKHSLDSYGSIYSLSNVGFNSDCTQAFVYVEHLCGSLCGGGNYIFLKKQNGIWNVAEILPIWVS